MNEELQKQIEAEKAKLDIKDEVQEPEQIEPQAEVAPEESQTIEQKAMAMGWDPNHKGPSFVSAKEYVERGSFFRKIDAQNKKIDELMSVVKQLDAHNRQVQTAAYNQGIQDALKKRREAVEIGDVQAYDQAEAELNRLKQNAPKPEATTTPQQQPGVSQDMLDWVEENKTWFNNSTKENMRMVKEADGLFVLESQENPNLSHKEILSIVKDKLIKLHPDKFENPNKAKSIAVTPTKPVMTKGINADLAHKLSSTQKKFFDDAKRAGSSLTIEEYVKQLELIGAIRND